jgi:uncharacterized protein (DUF433 family)
VYGLADAAHYLDLPRATVHDWALGHAYPAGSTRRSAPAVIAAADREARLLSFRNLVELHVLAALRRQHEVSLQNIRRAVAFMRKQLAIEAPLASLAMLTDGKDLLIEHSGELLNVSREGQLEMRKIVEAYLSRIEHSTNGAPSRLYPFTGNAWAQRSRPIVIDPRVQFGRPCIAGTGVPTEVLVGRLKAGESIASIAGDYDLEPEDVEEAIRFEIKLAA